MESLLMAFLGQRMHLISVDQLKAVLGWRGLVRAGIPSEAGIGLENCLGFLFCWV